MAPSFKAGSVCAAGRGAGIWSAVAWSRLVLVLPGGEGVDEEECDHDHGIFNLIVGLRVMIGPMTDT